MKTLFPHEIRSHLIAAGVRNLKEFGYPYVNADNILTDRLYASFFISMCKDNYGKGFDVELDNLIIELEKSGAR